jgi:hypothetical protein
MSKKPLTLQGTIACCINYGNVNFREINDYFFFATELQSFGQRRIVCRKGIAIVVPQCIILSPTLYNRNTNGIPQTNGLVVDDTFCMHPAFNCGLV